MSVMPPPAVEPETPATVIIARRLVVAVIPANIGPLRPMGRPYPAPAAVIVTVVGIGEGEANERETTEAVMEEEAVMSECSVRKAR